MKEATEQDLRTAFGGRLRSLREGRQLTLEKLAESADVTWSYVSDLERGTQSPSLDVVNRLARGLEVTLAELFAPLSDAYAPRKRSGSDGA